MKKIALINLKYLTLFLSALLLIRCEDDPTDFGYDPIPDPGPDIVITNRLEFGSAEFRELYPKGTRFTDDADSTIAFYPATENLVIYFPGLATPHATFTMGNTGTSNIPPGEHPQHLVATKAFRAMRFEVTVEQFRKFVLANPGKVSMPEEPYWGFAMIDPVTKEVVETRENFPVVNVTWKEAKAYAEWVGGRLPTEAEFEFMAGGLWRDRKAYGISTESVRSAFYFGNSYQKVKTIVQNGQTIERWGRMPYPVGSVKYVVRNETTGLITSMGTIFTTITNAATSAGTFTGSDRSMDPILDDSEKQGVSDISGNVMEWCSDWHSENYYQQCFDGTSGDTFWNKLPPLTSGGEEVDIPAGLGKVVFDPQGPPSGTHKVARGGSFLMADNPYARNFTRLRAYPGTRDEQIGFRVVWDVE